MTWLARVTAAIRMNGGEAHLDQINDYIRRTSSAPLPNSWKAIVRQTIYDHSSDAAFRSGIDRFYSVDYVGSGRWGVR